MVGLNKASWPKKNSFGRGVEGISERYREGEAEVV